MDEQISSDPVHEIILAYYMRSLYSSKFLSDVVLSNPNGLEIKAHKLVLASYSEFFRTKFKTSIGVMDEIGQGNIDCTVTVNLSPDFNGVLEDIIKFMYTGEITFTENSIFMIMEVESLLLVGSLRPLICQYLQATLSVHNCLYVVEQSELFGYYDVSETALLYAKESFSEVLATTCFLEASFEVLMRCLKPPYLVIQSEDQLLLKLCEWIKHSERDRIFYLKELLEFIEPSSIQNWRLTVTEAQTILSDVAPDAVERNVFDEWSKKAELTININVGVESPYCQLLCNVILAAGGFVGERNLNSVECLTSLQRPWKLTLPSFEPSGWSTDDIRPIPLMSRSRSWIVATSFIFDTFVIGSDEGSDCTTSERYNIVNNKWSDLPTLNIATVHSAIAYVNGSLYCSGGLCRNTVLNNVWVLSKNAGSWRTVAPMQEARYEHQLVALNGLLYAIGGSGGQNKLSSVEMYNPLYDNWIFVSPLDICRSGHGCVVIDNSIYTIGGLEKRIGTNTTNVRYDVTANKWIPCGSMELSLGKVKCVAFGKDIVITSGSHGQRVSIFNICTNTSVIGPSMNQLRVGHALTVVKIPLRKKPPI